MKNQQTTHSNDYNPSFRVIKGFKIVQSATQEQLISNAWNFAFTALWNNTFFSKAESETAKASIDQFISAFRVKERGHSVFCQRVLLARHYINAQPNRYIPLPSVWLDKNNPTGFAGTKNWYKDILAVRSSLPNYKAELKAFAEAIVEMCEEPTPLNFKFWRNYFIEKKAPGLLNLFLATIANQHFNL